MLLYIVTYNETNETLLTNLLSSKIKVNHAHSLFFGTINLYSPYSDTKYKNSSCFFSKNKGYRELM